MDGLLSPVLKSLKHSFINSFKRVLKKILEGKEAATLIERKSPMNTELMLISELMSNSRRSDKDLARKIGTSKQKVSRTLKKLEQEGYIKEYTMLPDFHKLGFDIMSFTFIKLMKKDEATIEQFRKDVRQKYIGKAAASLLTMNGMGSEVEGDEISVAFHEGYAEYLDYLEKINAHPLVDAKQTKSFLASMGDETHFQRMTMSVIADYLRHLMKNGQRVKTGL